MKTTRRIAGALALAAVMVACTDQETVDSAAQDTTQAADAQVQGADTTGFIDPNDATREELVAVGLDPAEVEALIASRPYATMARVDSVLDLDSATAERVYARIWMPIDLNTASPEEILLIPGVGARMQHEFEEYRPYRGIEQFRREIGKYVDDAEVARLERYVTIR
jgi:DNA uptake protein ComE-like DNA-binding protein